MNKKGQSIIEFAYIYSIITLVIIVTIGIIVLLIPGVFNPQITSYISGFNGLRIISQNYINGKLNIIFQNLINENINITDIYMLYNGNVITNYKCASNFVGILDYDSCNISAVLQPNFYVVIKIQYFPSNSSFKDNINITGSIQG